MPFADAFTHFPTLTTPRLTLRAIQPTDAEAFFAIKSDPEVTTRYGSEPHQSLDQTRAWTAQVEASYAARDALFWCVTHTGGDDTAIGSVTLWRLDPDNQCGELGYELHPAHWRQGIMAEAIPAVLSFGFRELGLHRIEAVPSAINPPSSSLLRKLGFTHEGTLRQRIFFRGAFQDELTFSMLADEWQKGDSND